MMTYKKTLIISVALTLCLSTTAQDLKFTKIASNKVNAPYIFRFTDTKDDKQKALEDLKNGALKGWFAKNNAYWFIVPLGLSLLPIKSLYLRVAGLSSPSLLRKGCAAGVALLPLTLVSLYQVASYQPEWFSYIMPKWAKTILPDWGQQISLQTAITNAKGAKNLVVNNRSADIFYEIIDNNEKDDKKPPQDTGHAATAQKGNIVSAPQFFSDDEKHHLSSLKKQFEEQTSSKLRISIMQINNKKLQNIGNLIVTMFTMIANTINIDNTRPILEAKITKIIKQTGNEIQQFTDQEYNNLKNTPDNNDRENLIRIMKELEAHLQKRVGINVSSAVSAVTKKLRDDKLREYMQNTIKEQIKNLESELLKRKSVTKS